MNEPDLTVCEECGQEVELSQVGVCSLCALDPLCDDCRVPDEHDCLGKPGKPGELTLEVGQRVQDKFERTKQSHGRIVEIDGDEVSIIWTGPKKLTSPPAIPISAAKHLLENSELRL